MVPKNFSWLEKGRVAGLGFPGSDDELRYLVEVGVSALASLTEEKVLNTDRVAEMAILRVGVKDFTPPSLHQIQESLEFIEQQNNVGKAVGVHCAHGKGRTGTILACYLVRKYSLSAEEAIRRLRALRPGSVETSGQEKIVSLYEQFMRAGTNIQTGDAAEES